MGGTVTKVAVSGAAGRMGRLIVRIVLDREDTELAAAIEPTGHPELGEDAGRLSGAGDAGVLLSDSWSGEADALIDFSSPQGALIRLGECEKYGTAVVVGTTGLGDDFHAAVKAASEKIACIVAPNMSVGMNVLFNTVGVVADSLGAGYDIEIIEAHHRLKKDAPSGTALRLAECITEAGGPGNYVYGREGMVGERKPDELGIHAIRAGDIAGVHTVLYSGGGETIEITHRAHGREAFATGAVRAAVFAASAAPGLYDMGDVLLGKD